jgi:hypothetical protein
MTKLENSTKLVTVERPVMLHDRNLWSHDWCNFIANHYPEEFRYHRQNGYPTIARDISLLTTLENWKDKEFFSNSSKNASR